MRDGLHLKFTQIYKFERVCLRAAIKFIAARFAFRKFTAKAEK